MVYATFNIVSVIYHTCAIGRRVQEAHAFCNFNNVSIIYHSFAVGRGFRRLIFFATFKNVSVFYQSFAVGSGVQEAHCVCHFQYCFSHLPHMCYTKGGSGCSCLLPLFQ